MMLGSHYRRLGRKSVVNFLVTLMCFDADFIKKANRPAVLAAPGVHLPFPVSKIFQ